MSAEEKRGNNQQQNNSNSNNTITAIGLARLVVDVTSTLIPVVQELDIDAELKGKIVEALQRLQRKAIDYTFAYAERKSRRGGGRQWRAKPQRRTWR